MIVSIIIIDYNAIIKAAQLLRYNDYHNIPGSVIRICIYTAEYVTAFSSKSSQLSHMIESVGDFVLNNIAASPGSSIYIHIRSIILYKALKTYWHCSSSIN